MAKNSSADLAALAKRDPVTAYALSVVNKKRCAGPLVRAACRRHLRDLDTAHRRGLRFDLEKAERVYSYFRKVLRLNGGQFEGRPFELVGWEQFVVGSLFGWVREDGTRRFRVAYVETGKGSGKSPLAAGIGMYGLTSDGEARAEIYAAATKKDQAMVLFRDATAMRQQSPKLREKLRPSGTGEQTWNLAYLDKGSFFRPISADDGQSGPRPHFALVDELHEHKTNVVVEMLSAGTKWRRQPLLFMITNSGSNKLGPCWGYHDYGDRVVNGELDDDEFFAFICSLDEDDDPFKDEACWPKANPSLEDAQLPGMDYLRKQVREARGMPGKEALVRRLSFCQWTGAESPWLSYEAWKAAERQYDWHELRGRRALAGLDLSSTTDLTGLVLFVEPENPARVLRTIRRADGSEEEYLGWVEPWKMVPFCWLPEVGLQEKQEKDRVPYLQWRDEGLLETTAGRAINKLHVLQRVIELSAFFNLELLAYDRWRIEDLKSLADQQGLELPPMAEFGQGYKDMSPAIETFETMLLNGEVIHPGHKVLSWCFGNAVIEQDGALNRKLSKEKATGRIDLAVAGVMAARLTMAPGEGSLDEFFESPVIA